MSCLGGEPRKRDVRILKGRILVYLETLAAPDIDNKLRIHLGYSTLGTVKAYVNRVKYLGKDDEAFMSKR